MISVALRQDEGEEQVKDDLAIVDRISGHICHKPMPKLGERAVSAGVDVEIAEHNCVQAVRLSWPLQHRLEPGHICRESHARESAYGLVSQIQGIARGMVDDVRNDLRMKEKLTDGGSTLGSPRCP